MKTPIIATTSLVFLSTVACESGGQNAEGYEISQEPLSGIVFGEAWSFVNGDTNASLSEGEDDFFSQLFPVEFDACLGSHPSENDLVMGIPKEPGEYPLGWEQTITFSDGSTNLAATDGQLDVYEITDTTISAGLYAKYGDDNEVNGQFEVEICEW